MKQFIQQCRDSKERLEIFDRVYALSKAQRSPYHYMKMWFLDNYANYSEKPEFDEKGFVIVKTKAQMEEEKREATKADATLENTVPETNEDDSAVNEVAAGSPKVNAIESATKAA